MPTEQKKHILLIDDDDDELAIFDAAMSELNISFKCTYARSAEHALKILQYIVPDFIFVDYNMPKMDGLTCLKEIKSIPGLRQVPVVIYSNYISKEVNEEAHNCGVHICFNKPSKLATFTAILKDIITRREEKVISALSGNNK